MTCIVGMVDKKRGGVVMGADSIGSDGWTKGIIASPKIFTIKTSSNRLTIGYTSSFRMGQILQYHLKVPPHDFNIGDEEYIVTKLIPAIRSTLKDHGYSKVENNVERGGVFLVGYRRSIFKIQSDFSVLHYLSGFAAVGSDETFAIGAMHALMSTTKAPASRIVKTALSTAAANCATVSGPFTIITER